jgi:hypothetical protein
MGYNVKDKLEEHIQSEIKLRLITEKWLDYQDQTAVDDILIKKFYGNYPKDLSITKLKTLVEAVMEFNSKLK